MLAQASRIITDNKACLDVCEANSQDLVEFTASTDCCLHCYKYDSKVFSISGKIIHTKNGIFNSKETITLNKFIGETYDKELQKYVKTNKFVIHYSKSGTHIVPIKNEE